jgi:peptidoglycan/xylan/chitin deacetylase (PgdA/CDA1 family)
MRASSRPNTIVPATILLFLPALWAWLNAAGAEPVLYQTHLTYTIDRTAVPNLYYNDLTLNIYVGAVISVEVTSNGQPLPYQYDAGSGYVTFTSSAVVVTVRLEHQDLPGSDAGSFAKAPLKHNKKWAWSHGLDDNTYLRPAIELMAARGWRGTLFLIGKEIEDERDEEWIIDAPAIRELVGQGWSFGSHTWDHACDADRLSDPTFMRTTILNGFYRLDGIIQSSSVPDYRLISFASPCFRSEYHPYILQMVADGETDVLFDEAGNDYRLIVNPGAADYNSDGRTAVAFNPSRRIGRDPKLELGAAGIAGAKAEMDWMAVHAAPDRHFWYNSLTHGHWQDALGQLVEYVYDQYGPGGSNEVWVAPSDEIYSYLLVRDGSQVSYTIEVIAPPTATPTLTATAIPSPTATPLPLPTTTRTITPSATSTAVATPAATASPPATTPLYPIYLPLALNR